MGDVANWIQHGYWFEHPHRHTISYLISKHRNLHPKHCVDPCYLVLIRTIFAVIKACLAAAVAALAAGISIVATVVVLAVIIGFAVAGMFGIGGSRFAARRRAKRDGNGG